MRRTQLNRFHSEFEVFGVEFQPPQLPEPSTGLMLMAGLFGMVARRTRVKSMFPLALFGMLLLPNASAHAATITWNGGGDGTSWNDAGNWGGTQPGQTDTVHITTSATIDNVYRDAGTNTYSVGSTLRSVVNLNQGTIVVDHTLESGPGGVFNIGNGIGTADAIVNVTSGGSWMFDRHSTGTYTLNIRSDGQLNTTGTGTLLTYGETNRHWVMNIDGGFVNNVNAWNMGDSSAVLDPNFINLTNEGSLISGSVTLGDEVIDFADGTKTSIEFAFGGSFPNAAAATAAIGTTFISTGGQDLKVFNLGGSFLVADSEFFVLPEPSTGLLLMSGLFGMASRRRRKWLLAASC